MTKAIELSVRALDLSLASIRLTLECSTVPYQRRLVWAAAELEKLAVEAYAIADEAGDDPGSPPATDPCREPIPGFDLDEPPFRKD